MRLTLLAYTPFALLPASLTERSDVSLCIQIVSLHQLRSLLSSVPRLDFYDRKHTSWLHFGGEELFSFERTTRASRLPLLLFASRKRLSFPLKVTLLLLSCCSSLSPSVWLQEPLSSAPDPDLRG